MSTEYAYVRDPNTGELSLVIITPSVTQDPDNVFNPTFEQVTTKELCMIDDQDPSNKICIKAEDPVASDYTICWPKDEPTAGDVMEVSGVTPNFTTAWIPLSGGGGFVQTVGAPVVDNAIVRYDGVTGQFIQEGTLTLSDTGTLDSSTNITIDTSTFTFDITNSSTDANAIDLQATGGGIRLSAVDPIYITTTSNSNLNDIELEAINGRVLVDSTSCRLLLTDTAAQTFFVEANTGGVDINAGLDITLDSGGDIDLTATDISITSTSNSNPNSIDISAAGTDGGVNIVSTGLNGVMINNSEFNSSGFLTMANSQGIFMTNSGISFSDGSFNTTILNPTSATQNISIRLPNDTGAVGDVISVDSEVSNLHITSFNSVPSILNALGTVDLSSVDLTLNTLSMNGNVDMNNNSITDCIGVSNATTLSLFTSAGNVALQGILIDTSNNMSNIASIDVSGSSASSIASTAAGNAITLDSTGGSGDVNINGNFFRNNGDLDLAASGNFGSSTSALNIASTTGQVNLQSVTQLQLFPGTTFNVTAGANGNMTFSGDLDITTTGSDCNINDTIIRDAGIELNDNGYLRFVRNSMPSIYLELRPPGTSLAAYSLELPDGVGSISAGEFKPMLVNSSNKLSFGSDVSYAVSLVTPVTAQVGDICAFTNVSQYSVKINSAPTQTINNFQYSGYINGGLPDVNNSIDVPLITTVSGSTVFSITGGQMLYRNNTDPTNPVYEIITCPTFNNITSTLLGSITENTYYIYLNFGNSNNPLLVTDVVQTVDPPGMALDNPAYAYIGNIDIDNILNQNVRANEFVFASYDESYISQLLHASKGHYVIEGIVFGNTGASLTLGHTAGKMIRLGVSPLVVESPNIAESKADEQSVLRYQYKNASGNWISETQVGFDVVPDFYINAGVKTAMPPNRFSNQYLWFFAGSNSIRISWDTANYGTMADALAAVTQNPFPQNPATSEASLRCCISIDEGATDLSNTAEAVFTLLEG